MKTAGIIAEYNPFHRGHLYQLRELKKRTGADYVIAVMSGDFVQRGEPAIFDKYTRTRMALSAGVDLVLELPVLFATGSAEDFAACGVALLDKLGVVDELVFGSEAGELAPLAKAARVLAEEPADYVQTLRELTRQGLSFPKARGVALAEVLNSPEQATPARPDWETILSSPNNILGIEYLKALNKRKSPIRPFTIARAGQGYHDETIGASYASASAIRKAIREGNVEEALSQIPAEARQPLLPTPIYPDDLSLALNWKLTFQSGPAETTTALTPDSFPALLSRYADMSPELAARLEGQRLSFDTFTGRIGQLKTRGYTYTRISRALLHVLLEITAEATTYYKSLDYALYGRVLGFRREAAPLLGQIKKAASIPLITKTADAPNILDADGLRLLQTDMAASHRYQALAFEKSGQLLPNEYTRSVIIV